MCHQADAWFGARLGCMKMVGTQDRGEIELDPQIAWQRCKRLDAMLRTARAPYSRGVWRLTHEQMNRLDLERQLALAAKVNLLSG
jgi:hypothetical protein